MNEGMSSGAAHFASHVTQRRKQNLMTHWMFLMLHAGLAITCNGLLNMDCVTAQILDQLVAEEKNSASILLRHH